MVPPPWHALPLSQADLGPLFSNSSPFAFTQSLLMVPPAGAVSKAGVRASFGPYSVSQPPLGLCVVTLALPKDWFEADQTSQPYLSPNQHARQTHHTRNRGRRHEGGVVGGTGGVPFPGALRYSPAHAGDRIQLYYSLFGTASNRKLAPPRCVQDKLPPSQRELFYIGAVTLREYNKRKEANGTKEKIGCCNGQEEEELWLDSNVLIRYRRGPVRAGQPIGVSVNLRPNFSAEFVVIRLKVKKGLLSLVAQRSLNSDLWVVNLERTQGSKHDVISIICHKLARHMDSDGYYFIIYITVQ
nr:transmembrane protein 132A-like [Salvelinus alpinus]